MTADSLFIIGVVIGVTLLLFVVQPWADRRDQERQRRRLGK